MVLTSFPQPNQLLIHYGCETSLSVLSMSSCLLCHLRDSGTHTVPQGEKKFTSCYSDTTETRNQTRRDRSLMYCDHSHMSLGSTCAVCIVFYIKSKGGSKQKLKSIQLYLSVNKNKQKKLHRKCLKSAEYRESSRWPIHYSLLCLI